MISGEDDALCPQPLVNLIKNYWNNMSTLIIQSFLESVLLDSNTFDSISKYVTDDQTISLPPYSRGHKYADFS